MSYSLYDFVASCARAGLSEHAVERVVTAWGEDGSYAEWTGGFLMKLKDGRYAYLSGWCDTTGWGCQDGASIEYFDSEPDLKSLEPKEDWETKPSEWERDPEDLARFLRGETKLEYRP